MGDEETLEHIVNASTEIHPANFERLPVPVKEHDRVYFLSEVGYDTHHFNPEAYGNLLTYMSRDPELTGVVIDGAISRLDRPEYLNEALTYWLMSEEDGKEEMEKVKNREQYQIMLDKQISTLNSRLAEVRKKVPKAEIVLNIDTDDFQYTVKELVNEAMLRKTIELEDQISFLKGRKHQYKSSQEDAMKKRQALSGQSETYKQRGGLTRKVNTLSKAISDVDTKLQDLYAEKNLYRAKKARPIHQIFTRQFIENLDQRIQSICDKNNVKLIKNREVLKFGDLTVEYAHSREPNSWTPLKMRDQRFTESMNGKPELLNGIDALVESGHFGSGFRQVQKLHYGADEINFKNQDSYDPRILDKHILYLMVLPFEDQERVGRYISGKERIRMSAGKPTNTKSSEVIKRQKNGGVSGLTILSKNRDGILGTEWRQYRDFIDGSVLIEHPDYSMIYATSDEHIGSPETNPMAQRGMLVEYKRAIANPDTFRGKPILPKGYLSGGDTGEANSKKWDHRYHHQPDIHQVLKDNIHLITKLVTEKDVTPERILKAIMKVTEDARSGSVESMDTIMGWVANYYGGFLDETLKTSNLKFAHTSVPGNHADGVLKDVGLKEHAFFRERLVAKGIPVYEVGVSPRYNPPEDARVALGGYSNARVINIPNYGLDVNGKPLFGPINLLLQHDPKGGGKSGGLVGAGKKANADLAIAGHTHETYVKTYSTGPNTFSVALRMATLQGTTPTEIYYASGLPRTTSAGHRFMMPTPGHFYEEFLPVGYLHKRGREDIEKEIIESLE
ncbi:MAG: hypothetical protein Q8Q01_04690 [archaeon]|nr:hypothetical protein [archaeon]